MKDLQKLNDFLATAIETLHEINEELRGKPKIGEYAYFRRKAGQPCVTNKNEGPYLYGILENYWYSKDEKCTLYVCRGGGVFFECNKNVPE